MCKQAKRKLRARKKTTLSGAAARKKIREMVKTKKPLLN